MRLTRRLSAQELVAEAVEELVKEADEQSTKKGLGDLQTNRSKHFVSVIPTIDILVVVFLIRRYFGVAFDDCFSIGSSVPRASTTLYKI